MLELFVQLYHAHYKKWLVLSLCLLFLSLGYLGVKYLTTGEFAARGVSLKGGITLTVPLETNVNLASIQPSIIAALPQADLSVRGIYDRGNLKAMIVEASDVEVPALLDAVRTAGIVLEEGTYSVESMGSSLGERFYRQTLFATLFAFLCMSLVVYATFREVVPALFVILCAFSDILSTLAVVSFLDMKLSTASIAAFLMLIGYAIDENILLTTRVLRRKEGTIPERISDAMGTGLTMTMTAFAAVLVSYFFSDADTLKQIMFIMMIGLLWDVIYTWAQNAGILRWYIERKGLRT